MDVRISVLVRFQAGFRVEICVVGKSELSNLIVITAGLGCR